MLNQLGTMTAALLLGAVGGVVGSAIASPDVTPQHASTGSSQVAVSPASEPYAAPDPGAVVAHPPYPVNANGMTFGSGANIDADDPGPDLLGAFGVDGTFGYIRSTDRDQPARTLADARAATKSRGGGYDVPLYAQDGVTVIGSFHISG